MGYLVVSSPVGDLTIFEEKGAIVALEFGRAGESSCEGMPIGMTRASHNAPLPGRAGKPDPEPSALLARAARQLDEYFAGRRKKFDLPLRPAGTPFQRKVWARLAAIPYGKVETYGALAKVLRSGARANPRARTKKMRPYRGARAVGGACGANPIPILIPCHRVLGANGGLGGYSGAGGVATKRFLLAQEGLPAQ
jgi:methylated-DNA-[protein]-cysteine S-methyltransferase